MSLNWKNSVLVVSFLVASNAIAIDLNPIKIIKAAVNPIGTIHEEVAKPVAEKIGVNPEIAGKAVNPVGQIIDHAPQAAVEVVKTEIKHIEGLVEGVREGRVDKILLNEVRNEVDKALNPAVVEASMPLVMMTLVPLTRDSYMQAPELERVNGNRYSGDPIVYVNGMATDHDLALIEARALSGRMKRPVDLLYNGSQSGVRDFGECIIDRFGILVLQPVKPQFNSTTKQLAHLIYHADRPVSLVTHSQGSLIARNALMIAETFRSIRHNVAWVATGFPMRREEVYPEPAKFRTLANPDDSIVAQLLSLNFDPEMLTKVDPKRAHSFSLSYVSKIDSKDLFGSGEERDRTAEEIEASWKGIYEHSGKCSVVFRNDGVHITNEKGHTATATLINNTSLRVQSGESWDAGLEADLRGAEIHWRNGSVWKRAETAAPVSNDGVLKEALKP